jgi:hypothetical protein
MKTGVYIMGDFSMFRNDCWVACASSLYMAKVKAQRIVSKYPSAKATVVGTLDNVKKNLKLNNITTFTHLK